MVGGYAELKSVDMLSITSKVVFSVRNPGGGWRRSERRCGMEPARRCKKDRRSSSGDLSLPGGGGGVVSSAPWVGAGVGPSDRMSLSRCPTMGAPVSV